MKTIIFRPTNKCNLACSYCYDKNNHNNEELLKQSVSKVFEQEEQNIYNSIFLLFKNENNPHLIFHGGEPLLLNSKLFERFCFNLSNKYNIRFSIQTNGTLINKDFIEIFKKYNFNIGISLDGCNDFQNSCRVYPNGLNSFSNVMKNLELLKLEKIKFGLIMSISKKQINQEKELYDFIAMNNFYCNIRPIFQTSDSCKNLVLSPDEYFSFLSKLFELWYFDKDDNVKTKQIHEFYSYLRKELDKDYFDKTCNNSKQCFKEFVVMDVFSNVYACNRLYGINKFYYGNLKKEDVSVIYDRINDLLIEKNKYIEDKCSDCEQYTKCYGDCPAESYQLYGDLNHISPNCKIKKMMSKHIKENIL